MQVFSVLGRRVQEEEDNRIQSILLLGPLDPKYPKRYGQWYCWQASNDEWILWSEGERKGRKGQGLQDEEHGIDASIREFPIIRGTLFWDP